MVRSLQHGITGYYPFERVNGLGALGRPYEGHVLLRELLHRSYYVSVSLDEGAIVSEQAQCAPNVMYVVQHFLPHCYDFSPSYAYDTMDDSYRTLGLLTPLCLSFAP